MPSPICAASSDLKTRACSLFQRPGQALKTLPSPGPFPPLRVPGRPVIVSATKAPRRRWPCAGLALAGLLLNQRACLPKLCTAPICLRALRRNGWFFKLSRPGFYQKKSRPIFKLIRPCFSKHWPRFQVSSRTGLSCEVQTRKLR